MSAKAAVKAQGHSHALACTRERERQTRRFSRPAAKASATNAVPSRREKGALGFRGSRSIARALTELPGNLWDNEDHDRRRSEEGKLAEEELKRKRDAAAAAAVSAAASVSSSQQSLDSSLEPSSPSPSSSGSFSKEAFTLGWPRTLHECYDVGEEIGRGSFGIVRVATERWPVQFTSQGTSNPYLQQKFAVKSIPKRPRRRTRRKRIVGVEGDERANAEKAILRQKNKLLGEVAFMVSLADCPFSAQLVGAYEDETHAHLVVELCEGGDLKHLLKRRGTLSEKEAGEVIYTVLNFINHCHHKGFVFSDVKPANFMLKFKAPDEDEEDCSDHLEEEEDVYGGWSDRVSSSNYTPLVVKGIDFGCSQRTGDAKERGMLIKRTGTPAYWAPEVFMRYYNHRADVWSCGMMMYELLVGKLPFWDDIERCSPKQVQTGVMFGELNFDFNSAQYATYDSIGESGSIDMDDMMDEQEGGPVLALSESAKDLIRRMLDKDPRSRISVEEALDHPWIRENHT